ncbi:PHD finger protein 14 [Cichlidogyrus casuarinus]|uniref:PHD finger protein 14 n=1 Tax=Cichlidogyrus casuarinus TaxID=1844966 RepID=A0ABD2QFQ0_9PLAT
MNFGCSVCNKAEDQHLIAICDTCKKSYHINCLSPPLSRVPKRSTRWLWQCCFCTKLEIEKEVEQNEVDLDEPRRLRKSGSAIRPLDSVLELDDDDIRPKRVRREVKRPNFINSEFCIDSPPKRKPKSQKATKEEESTSSRSSTVAQIDSTSPQETKKGLSSKICSPTPTDTAETISVDSQQRNSFEL